MKTHAILLTFFISTLATTAFCKELISVSTPLDTVTQKKKIGAFMEETLIFDVTTGDEEERSLPNLVVRPIKNLPLDVEGYKIELLRVFHKPLAPSDELFQKHGNVMVERIGEHCYAYILGGFETYEALEKFFNTVIKPVYTKSMIVKYKKGVRVQ